MKIPRETPAGFLLDAGDFLKAGELLLNRATGVSLPTYFLFSRSIELSFKAYLLAHGLSAKELSSRKLGHNLTALLDESNQRGLSAHIPLESIEAGVLNLLSQEYLSTRLGYRISGIKYHLPLIEVTESVARKLFHCVNELYGQLN